HHAQLVADAVKIIRLVNPSTPDPQHIPARVDRLLDALPHASRIAGAIEKAVVGDPVEAFAEDGLAVDFHDELGADGVGGGVELDGAEARTRRPVSFVATFRSVAEIHL